MNQSDMWYGNIPEGLQYFSQINNRSLNIKFNTVKTGIGYITYKE